MAATAMAGVTPIAAAATPKTDELKTPPFKLGMVTYNLAMNWDLPTIIKNCKEIGITAVEFRADKGHKHGVELTLNKDQRRGVRKQCADGGLVIWGIGSACEYHSTNPAALEKNIEDTKRYIELARDVGAKGVKVRPNRLPEGVSKEKTLEQIGRSLAIVGQAAANADVEIWVEVHGGGTSHPPHIRTMMDIANHPSVGVNWNSNRPDIKDGSINEYFELLRPKLMSVHMNDLTGGYPYRELFSLLTKAGYDRYTMIEAQPMKNADMKDNIRFAKYYKALWEELSRPA
jgi:sugar phosphate isomerase/epimerase